MVRFGETSGRNRSLCIFYGLFTVANTIVFLTLAIAYVLDNGAGGIFGVVRDFVRDALVNPAAVFVYADLTIVWIALAVFMVVEARRLGIRYVWAYIIGAPALALGVTFPAFMFIRQLKIATEQREVLSHDQ